MEEARWTGSQEAGRKLRGENVALKVCPSFTLFSCRRFGIAASLTVQILGNLLPLRSKL